MIQTVETHVRPRRTKVIAVHLLTICTCLLHGCGGPDPLLEERGRWERSTTTELWLLEIDDAGGTACWHLSDAGGRVLFSVTFDLAWYNVGGERYEMEMDCTDARWCPGGTCTASTEVHGCYAVAADLELPSLDLTMDCTLDTRRSDLDCISREGDGTVLSFDNGSSYYCTD